MINEDLKGVEFIVRIWPSGTLTMGKVCWEHVSYRSTTTTPMFLALENYPHEGGVKKDGVYGSICGTPRSAIQHRLATSAEIIIYNIYGAIQNRKNEIKQYERDNSIDLILD